MQDQARRLELNPTELKNQYQADHSIYRQKMDKEAENMFPQALQGQKRVLGMPKNITFELLLDENVKARARFPMRVQIYHHDTTDSIVITVKNFYGIYDYTISGVSFEMKMGPPSSQGTKTWKIMGLYMSEPSRLKHGQWMVLGNDHEDTLNSREYMNKANKLSRRLKSLG